MGIPTTIAFQFLLAGKIQPQAPRPPPLPPSRIKCTSLNYPLALFTLAIPIGCFRDTGRRAIATLEGRSRLLKGHYRRRKYAIQKCALAADKRRYRVFAIQHRGWCASARFAYRTYGKYGRSNRCRNGKGGPWANSVYILRGKEITSTMIIRV